MQVRICYQCLAVSSPESYVTLSSILILQFHLSVLMVRKKKTIFI